jgi:hypothetical protein
MGLEALDPHPLRVDAAHHVPDRAVLACSVECLEHHKDAVRVLRREPRLVLRQQLDAVLQQLHSVLLLLDPRLESGIEVLRQPHARTGIHAKRLDEAPDPAFHVRHLDLLPVVSACWETCAAPAQDLGQHALAHTGGADNTRSCTPASMQMRVTSEPSASQ